ncbi:hypothetical protein [Leptolyngbya sp. 7M]|uniref:hypothetical protein n=1 Tax=Leptolyngbya sp. 7M TaxID=2812896 RepID=UPI001B8BCB28|nr:hypothetical protein [Leptolyngbya sp. 7M]QYO63431.1 hypothetical protein JVX88_26560 [Leptolyngbya sp. 7M]
MGALFSVSLWLENIGTRWQQVNQVAEQLAQNADVATALSQYPDAMGAILEFGSDAVEALAQRFKVVSEGNSPRFWMESLANSPLEEGLGILEVLSRTYAEIPENILAADMVAYGRIVAATDDVSRITQAIGVPENVVARARQNLFLTEHEIPIGPNLTQRAFFAPDSDIADLWMKAMSNNLQALESERFKRILAHEYVESRLMEMGLPFRSSHPDVYNNRTGLNLPTPEHFGAHDLAPYAYIERPPFTVWETRLNRSSGDLTLADDLSNLDHIVSETYRIFMGE